MVNCLNLAYLVIFQLFKTIAIFLSIGKRKVHQVAVSFPLNLVVFICF